MFVLSECVCVRDEKCILVCPESTERGQAILVEARRQERRPGPAVLTDAVVAVVDARVVLLDDAGIRPKPTLPAAAAVLAQRREEAAFAAVATGRVRAEHDVSKKLAAGVGALGKGRKGRQRRRTRGRLGRWGRGRRRALVRAGDGEGPKPRQMLGRAVPPAHALAVVVGARTGTDAVAASEGERNRTSVDKAFHQGRRDAVVRIARQVGTAHGRLALGVRRRRVVVFGKRERRRRRKRKRRWRRRIGTGAKGHLGVLAPLRVLVAKLGLHVGKQEPKDPEEHKKKKNKK